MDLAKLSQEFKKSWSLKSKNTVSSTRNVQVGPLILTQEDLNNQPGPLKLWLNMVYNIIQYSKYGLHYSKYGLHYSKYGLQYSKYVLHYVTENRYEPWET